MTRLTVIGAGSWGSALAEHAGRCRLEVMLWAHDPQVAAAIRDTGSNPVYLPGAAFSPGMRVTSSIEEAAAWSDLVLMVTPSHHYRSVLTGLAAAADRPLRVISATKGIENDTLQRMSEVTRDVLGEKLRAVATLTGPTFAVETSRGDPTAAVVASDDFTFAEDLQRLLSSSTFRLYSSDDLVGAELCGSLKNVIAIAAGIVEGIGLGGNSTAALITRGLHEISRLGRELGGRPETFAGLAGMGDLILTCTGALSRNRSLGIELGHGRSLDEVLAGTRHVAEGVKTCRSVHDLSARLGVDMPITNEIYRILHQGESPGNAIKRLMSRSLKPEIENGNGNGAGDHGDSRGRE